jgi:hypothetical protein
MRVSSARNGAHLAAATSRPIKVQHFPMRPLTATGHCDNGVFCYRCVFSNLVDVMIIFFSSVMLYPKLTVRPLCASKLCAQINRAQLRTHWALWGLFDRVTLNS